MLSKKEFMKLIDKMIPENSYIDFTGDIEEPTNPGALIGIPFGSPAYIITESSREYRGRFNVTYQYMSNPKEERTRLVGEVFDHVHFRRTA